jgi:hypothetical protein
MRFPFDLRKNVWSNIPRLIATTYSTSLGIGRKMFGDG